MAVLKFNVYVLLLGLHGGYFKFVEYFYTMSESNFYDAPLTLLALPVEVAVPLLLLGIKILIPMGCGALASDAPRAREPCVRGEFGCHARRVGIDPHE